MAIRRGSSRTEPGLRFGEASVALPKYPGALNPKMVHPTPFLKGSEASALVFYRVHEGAYRITCCRVVAWSLNVTPLSFVKGF